MASFEVWWISKALIAQRDRRNGRTEADHYYHLYSYAALSKDDIFDEFSCHEISMILVDGVVLLMKFMEIDQVKHQLLNEMEEMGELNQTNITIYIHQQPSAKMISLLNSLAPRFQRFWLMVLTYFL
ncbi:hypothetical protein KFK09_014136 [Dendrobium nobile]|uniref:Uncharacterized protein n=1 Tax=Dendrobium nobile TaxID=94219 RepID=A0A8T3BAV3_DENNO|nr:hypothetical protein KFK09_014136 [Dendrobium nobile]